MAVALRIPPCYANGGAFARRHGQADFPRGFKGFVALDAGTDPVRFAGVVRAFVVEELDVFQVVGPEGQGACSYGFPVVASRGGQRIGRLRWWRGAMLLVTCVAYHKPDVVSLCEGYAVGDVRRLRDVDGAVVVVAQRAGTCSGGEGVAAFVREVGGHD